MTEPDSSPDTSRETSQRVRLFVLLGFCGGGAGVLLALLLGIENWYSGARLFLWGGIAVGVALAAVLARGQMPPEPTDLP